MTNEVGYGNVFANRRRIFEASFRLSLLLSLPFRERKIDISLRYSFDQFCDICDFKIGRIMLNCYSFS